MVRLIIYTINCQGRLVPSLSKHQKSAESSQAHPCQNFSKVLTGGKMFDISLIPQRREQVQDKGHGMEV